jgi:long-chain acyl-CoA synthetase
MKYKCLQPERISDVRELVVRASKLFSDRIAFKELSHGLEVLEYTYAQVEQDCNAFGTKLLQMGMSGYHIALISESSYNWVLTFLTVMCGVGVLVPLDKELMPEDIAALLHKSDADAIICSETFVPMITEILDECPNVKTVIVMNPTKAYPKFYEMPALISQGRKLVLLGDRSYREKTVDPDAMCELLFTSGTTGANKGVMLSHKNLLADLFGFMHYIRVTSVSFSVLPIHHSFESTCNIFGVLYTGNTLCINDSLKHLINNFAVFKPGMSLMVPLFLEAMYKSIWEGAKKEKMEKYLSYGIKISNLLRFFGIDLRRRFFRPVHEKFGGGLIQIVSGGAPLRMELIKKFDEIGINVINGYGITECAPVISTNASDWKKPGTVGRILPGCKVRIADPDKRGNGEIEVKGDIVMLGYYKDEAGTNAVFTEDGYFKTGDLGRLDKQNFLYITGRKKNLIILPNGKNVCPEELEAVIGTIPYVKEVMVYSDKAEGKDVIAADVFLDMQYFVENNITDIRQKLDQDIRRLNNTLPVYKRIGDVKIVEKEFEKTTTKKIKRQAEMKRRMYNEQLRLQKNT